MTFSNPVVGGTILLTPAIQSPDYQPGISGWFIGKDGSAAFNNVDIRGQVIGVGYELNADGLFFYNGIPTGGNLIGSWAHAVGIDTFGNQFPAGLQVTSSIGSVLLSSLDGTLMSTGSSERMVTMTDGSIQFSVVGDAGNGALSIGSSLRELVLHSGLLDVADRSGQLTLSSSTLTPTAGVTDTFPRVSTMTAGGSVTAHHYVSGAVVKSDLAGDTAEVWQVVGGNGAAYNTNWVASTTFNGSTGWQGLKYRKDAEDNLVIIGCFKSNATVGGTSVVTLPTAFRPAQQWPVNVQKNVAGTLTTGMGQISGGGNLNLLAGSGVNPTASAEYLITGTIPLGNIA